MAEALDVRVWRHPPPVGAAGRCIGRTDLDVDPGRAQALARRIATAVDGMRLPKTIWTSPSARCAAVGRLLAARGFVHRLDERLHELDFGAWDGLRWDAIDPGEVARWEANFAEHAAGGGESLAALRARARDFLVARTHAGDTHVLIVGHAGWINALRTVGNAACDRAADWPLAIGYGAMLHHRWTPA